MTEPRRVVPLAMFIVLLLVGGAVSAKEHGLRPQIDPDCLAGCREDLQLCLREARPEVEACLETCEEAIAKAREICAAEPGSEDCRAARREAEACVKECRKPINECIKAGHHCARRCAQQADPCFHCREEHQACVKNAAMEGRMCVAELCADELQKAREACAADPSSDECEKAREELRECIQPCREKHKQLIEECREALHDCREECGGDDTESARLR